MKNTNDCNFVLSNNPFIGVETRHGDFTNNDRIERIHFNGAKVAVLPDNVGLPIRRQLYTVLACIGMHDAEIANTTYVSNDTVKTSMAKAFENLDIASRMQIAPTLIDIHGLQIDRNGKPLDLSVAETPVVALYASGLTNQQVGRQLGLSGLTIKSHLSRIRSRTGLTSRAAIIFGALSSGEILPPECVVDTVTPSW